MKMKFLGCALFATTAMATAQAEEPVFTFGAHAFLDYENVEIDTVSEVNGTNLRLFRLDINGDTDVYSFKANVDFAGDDVKVKDLFVDFKGNTRIRVGNFKIINGLEQISSLYATVFAEAGSVAKVNGLSRAMGVGAFRSFGNLHLSGAVFGPDANDLSDKDIYSVSGRAAWGIPLENDGLLHLGVSSRFRDTGAKDAPFSYGQKPFAASAPNTVKTKAIADSDVFLGLEAAYLKGGFSIQSEFSQTQVDCAASACTDDPEFHAYYLDATYFIGGERVYSNGAFKRDKVHNPVGSGGRGALALSARYDVADLNDAAISGGKQESFVLGATWYRDKYVRIMANYVHAEFEDSPSYGDRSADSFILRAQFELY